MAINNKIESKLLKFYIVFGMSCVILVLGILAYIHCIVEIYCIVLFVLIIKSSLAWTGMQEVVEDWDAGSSLG